METSCVNRSFTKTKQKNNNTEDNGRTVCGTVLSAEWNKHKEGFLCSIFRLKDTGSFHVAVTQTQAVIALQL